MPPHFSEHRKNDHVYQDKVFHQNGYTPTNFDGNWTGEVTLKMH